MSEQALFESADRPHGGGERGMDRRRFVSMVSASMAASCLLRPAGMAWADGSLPEGESLIPGYLRPSHLMVHDDDALCRLSDPRAPFYETVRAAIPEELPLDLLSSAQMHGVPEHFSSGQARLWVHGMMPPDHVRLDERLLSAHLEVEVVVGAESHRHHAWSFSHRPVDNLPAPTAFEVPVDETSELRLHLTLEREEGGAGFGGAGVRMVTSESTTRTYTTAFTLKDRYEQPRLRAGIYALPLSAAAQSALPLPANHDWLVPEDLLYLLLTVQPLGAEQG